MKTFKRIVAMMIVLTMVMAILPVSILSVKGADNTIILNELEPFKGRTEEEIASRYYKAKNDGYYNSTANYYQNEPSLVAPYKGGKLKNDVHQAMTDMANYYRWLAGVDEYTRESEHQDDLQAGTVIQNLYFNVTNKVSNDLETDWQKPSNMDESFWTLGANVKHDLVALGYAPQQSLEEWLNEGYKVKNNSFDSIDDRHMLLSYQSKAMDFGYSGRVAYGSQVTGGSTDLPCVAYPAPGAYPNNAIDPDIAAWSVELNKKQLKYNTIDDVTIRVKDLSNNDNYECTSANGKLTEDNSELVFVQPEVKTAKYESSYQVQIIGLKDMTGKEKKVEYQIDFFDVTAKVPSTINHISSDWLNIYEGSFTANNVPLETIASILPSHVTITTDNDRTVEIAVAWQYNEEQHEYKIIPGSYTLPNLVNDNDQILKNYAILIEQVNRTDNSSSFDYSIKEGEATEIKVDSYMFNPDTFYWYKLLEDGTVEFINQTDGSLIFEDTNLSNAGQYFAVYKYSWDAKAYITPIKTLQVIPSKTLVDLELTAPIKTQYIVGQDLDLTGLELKAVYSDESTAVIDISEIEISGFDTSTPGKKTITVTYQGKTVDFEIVVSEKVLVSITVTPPAKVEYVKDQDLNLQGLEIVATYNDGSTAIIDNNEVIFSGYNKTKLGKQLVTVIYQERSAQFEVNVIAKVVTEIIVTPPTRVIYLQGEEIDLTGALMLVKYNDKSSKLINITNDMISGYDADLIGKQNVTVTYDGITASFEIEVIPNT